MKLNDYQEAARRTAVYPGKLAYPTLGLCGEVGELIVAYLTKSKEIPKEIGDVLWYVANVSTDAGMSLKYTGGQEDFDYIADSVWSKDEACSYLAACSGRVAENVKKTIRDNEGELSEDRRKNIRNALNKVLYGLAVMARNNGTTLDQCAEENLAKLQSRAERGVLKGDGDDR